MWEYICPKCRKEVKANSHECPHCGEKYPLALRIPPSLLKDSKKLEAYVHEQVFPRISAFERNYLTKYFTILFSDGFESGNFSAWTGTNYVVFAPTVQSSIVHSGLYAAEFFAPNGGYYSAVYETLSVPGNQANFRFYMYFQSLPTSTGGSCPIAYIDSTLNGGGFGTRLNIYYDGAKPILTLSQAAQGTNAWAGTTSIQINIWNCIEIQAQQTGNSFVYLNNSLEITGGNNGGYAFTQFMVGLPQCNGTAAGIYGSNNNQSGNTLTVDVDDVIIADTYIGPIVLPQPAGSIAPQAKIAGII